MADLWCYLSAQGVSSFRARARGVAYGIRLIYDEGNARNFRAFYVTKRTSGSFALSVMFSNVADYQAFGDWLQHWGGLAAEPVPSQRVQPFLRVTIPAINFDKSGVPTEGVTFGSTAGEVVKEMMIHFIGARDVIGGTVNLGESTFKNVDLEVSPELPYFYPAGLQLKGDEKGEDTIYEDPDYLKAAPMDTSWKLGRKGVI